MVLTRGLVPHQACICLQQCLLTLTSPGCFAATHCWLFAGCIVPCTSPCIDSLSCVCSLACMQLPPAHRLILFACCLFCCCSFVQCNNGQFCHLAWPIALNRERVHTTAPSQVQTISVRTVSSYAAPTQTNQGQPISDHSAAQLPHHRCAYHTHNLYIH